MLLQYTVHVAMSTVHLYCILLEDAFSNEM